MANDAPKTGLQLQSLVTSDGELRISLVEVPVPEPQPDEVVLRVEATPINPSDIGLLFAAADLNTVKASGSAERPVVTARIPEVAMKSMAGRVGKPMAVGMEGAGTVVAAGSSPQAQALLNRRVAVRAGGMYAQYRTVKASECLPLPADASAEDGASCFVNPLTALGMVETMRAEGHTALVHTAAASNLGQMLLRICREDGIGLVNVVRRPEQAQLLRSLGAKHVCDSSSERFEAELTEALAETGATIAFDAIGGGTLAARILACMEAALSRKYTEYSRYGTPVHKQVYLYGTLDPSPTVIARSFGFSWSVGGWLLFRFLEKIGPQREQALKERVAAGLKTTFASRYSKRVSLAQALQPDAIAVYGRRATGEKFLIRPNDAA